MIVDGHDDYPLIIGANRDEFLDRPAIPMAVLSEGPPRVIGGRDELAGGTWLAVNDAGVVAGLTNRPREGGRDMTKRSRGELPLALASHATVHEGVDVFIRDRDPDDYNRCWLLAGDRMNAFVIDMTADHATATPLYAGVHILENRPYGGDSPKVDHVRGLVPDIHGRSEQEIVAALKTVLSNHDVPPGAEPVNDKGEPIPVEVKAACVHTERYGTRWSGVILVPRDPAAAPIVRYADGPPCETEYALA